MTSASMTTVSVSGRGGEGPRRGLWSSPRVTGSVVCGSDPWPAARSASELPAPSDSRRRSERFVGGRPEGLGSRTAIVRVCRGGETRRSGRPRWGGSAGEGSVGVAAWIGHRGFQSGRRLQVLLVTSAWLSEAVQAQSGVRGGFAFLGGPARTSGSAL